MLQAEQVHPDVTISFLHFHPVLLPSLRGLPGARREADQRQRYVRRYYDVANYLFRQDFQHPEPVRAMVRRELPNLRHALALLLEQGYLEESSRLADSLAHFLTIFGLLREREQWRERIARGMAEQREQDDRTLTHAEYLHEIGQAQDERGRGNVRTAEARLSALLARIEAQPNGTRASLGSFVHVRTLQELGRCLQDAKQLTSAEVRSREALAMVERLIEKEPDEHTLLHAHTGLFGDLGSVLMEQGKYAQAKEAYEQALKGYTTLQETRNIAAIWGLLGVLAREQKEYVEARSHFLQSLERFESLEEPAEEATGWYNLGLVANVLAGVAERAGRPAEAEGWYRGALERIEQVEPGGINHSMHLGNLAGLLVKEVLAGRAPKARLVEARQFAEQALQIEEHPGISTDTWTIFSILAWIALLEEDREMARYYRLLERKSFAAFAGNRARIDQQHGALIAAVAQAARGDKAQRTAVEAAMPQLEQAGWHLGVAVERILAGERDGTRW